MNLFPFLQDSPTPFHAAAAIGRLLSAAGFAEITETETWTLRPGQKAFFRRGASAVAAFVTGADPAAGFRIAAAHTDSPGWRLKPAAQKPQPSGVVRIGTEVYGSPIHSTWFDRPLAIAGRVFVRKNGGLVEIPVHTEPLAVLPNLAIHYNREVNKGVPYDLQEHLCVLAALGGAPDLQTWLAARHGFHVQDFVSGDLFAVCAQPPLALGDDGLFVSPRIDNLTGCHAVAEALAAAKPSQHTQVGLFFDQEEIGSSTWTGADSSLLSDLLDRLVHGLGGNRETVFRAKAASFLLSVDSAHGVHPNYAGQHDGDYSPQLGQGPVLKASARFSYATTAATEAVVREAARLAQVPLQTYIMKSTLVPGSTVGPITTSWAGLPGADVGIPIWAMHSAVETAHRRDQDAMIALIGAVYNNLA